jgi:hypothetical protein
MGICSAKERDGVVPSVALPRPHHIPLMASASMARLTVTPVVKCKFQSVYSQTAAPQGKVQQHNLAAPWRLVRQDRTAALKFQNNQYCGSDPEAITERCGSFKLPRHRAWRGRAYMVTSPRTQLGGRLCRATPHGACGQLCRAVAPGAARSHCRA